jgi:hypothetical protein
MLPLRWTRIVLMGFASALLVSPAPAQAQAAGAYGPSSLARIRAALAEPPPRLQAPPPSVDIVPMFRVEITQPFTLHDPNEEPPADPTWGLPSAGELMMRGVGKVGSAVSGIKKRRVRREVRDALAEFCLVNTCPAQTSPQHRR